MKKTIYCVVVIILLGLSGCGGGGSQTSFDATSNEGAKQHLPTDKEDNTTQTTKEGNDTSNDSNTTTETRQPKPFVYTPNTIYHIQGQFNGEMLKQYLDTPVELGAWYNQNTHQLHLTPVVEGNKTYYKIASAFGHYFSAPPKTDEPLALDANEENRQLWEFVPHVRADGSNYGFFYIRNKATGEYLYDNIDPKKELNLRQPNRGFDLDKNQSYPTTVALKEPPKNDRRYLWRIDPTRTHIPDRVLALPQTGWLPRSNKIALLGCKEPLNELPTYSVKNLEGDTLFEAKAIVWGKYWSDHTYYVLNLNIEPLRKEGHYKLVCDGLEADIFIKKDALLHPLRQYGSDSFSLEEIFDPDFGFVTQWGRLTSWWPRAYEWLSSLSHWDWKLSKEDSPYNRNTFPHWMWRDIWDDNENNETYENLPEVATHEEAADCLDGGWDDTDTFAHNYAHDGQMLDELARLYRNTKDVALHDKIYDEILYGVVAMLKRQESDGQWRMGYMDKQHWSGTTAALGMGLAAVLPILQQRNAPLAQKVKNALDKTWNYMQTAKDTPESWAVPNEGIMYDGSKLKGYVGNQRTMWREAYLMLAVNLYMATKDSQYKNAVEEEILSGHFAYNGWMRKDPPAAFAGQYSTNAVYALLAMLRYYDDASQETKDYIKKLAKTYYDEYVVADTLIGGPFGNYSKRRLTSDGVDAWRIWEFMAASTQLYKHFPKEFARGLELSLRALEWYWGANPYGVSLMQGVGDDFMNYGWSSPHTLGRHMGLSVSRVNGVPVAKGTDGGWAMSEATVASSLSIWNSIVLMQNFVLDDSVQLYPKKNYKGAYALLTKGRYTFKMLKASGIENIASIKLPKGFSIKLYTQDNFEGEVVHLDSDDGDIKKSYKSVEVE